MAVRSQRRAHSATAPSFEYSAHHYESLTWSLHPKISPVAIRPPRESEDPFTFILMIRELPFISQYQSLPLIEAKDGACLIQLVDPSQCPNCWRFNSLVVFQVEGVDVEWKEVFIGASRHCCSRTAGSRAGTQGRHHRNCKGFGQFRPAGRTRRTSASGQEARHRQPGAIPNHGRACG